MKCLGTKFTFCVELFMNVPCEQIYCFEVIKTCAALCALVWREKLIEKLIKIFVSWRLISISNSNSSSTNFVFSSMTIDNWKNVQIYDSLWKNVFTNLFSADVDSSDFYNESWFDIRFWIGQTSGLGFACPELHVGGVQLLFAWTDLSWTSHWRGCSVVCGRGGWVVE